MSTKHCMVNIFIKNDIKLMVGIFLGHMLYTRIVGYHPGFEICVELIW